MLLGVTEQPRVRTTSLPCVQHTATSAGFSRGWWGRARTAGCLRVAGCNRVGSVVRFFVGEMQRAAIVTPCSLVVCGGIERMAEGSRALSGPRSNPSKLALAAEWSTGWASRAAPLQSCTCVEASGHRAGSVRKTSVLRRSWELQPRVWGSACLICTVLTQLCCSVACFPACADFFFPSIILKTGLCCLGPDGKLLVPALWHSTASLSFWSPKTTSQCFKVGS